MGPAISAVSIIIEYQAIRELKKQTQESAIKEVIQRFNEMKDFVCKMKTLLKAVDEHLEC